MSDAGLSEVISVGEDGFVSAEDVLRLRREIFKDGVVSDLELDALFQLGERAPDGDREWLDFFAEAATDFYLREEEPHGYFTQDEFTTLKTRIERDNDRVSHLELELMIRLMEKAVSTPPTMAGYFATRFTSFVHNKEGGPYISNADVGFIRRFLFAAGGDGNIAVTRAEAEFLFDLSDMTATAENSADWPDLFKKAIANHLMANIGYKPLGRQDALSTHASLTGSHKDNTGYSSPSNFFDRVKAGLSNQNKKVEERYAELNAEREEEAAKAEQVTLDETTWLVERIGKDGTFHTVEHALLKHMRALEADLPPELQALLDRAA